MILLSDFYKNKKTDVIWWVKNLDTCGELLISFDKKKIYNLFEDYPHNFTEEQLAIFDKENPYWRDFFSYRNKR